jgi:hypothetical protein
MVQIFAEMRHGRVDLIDCPAPACPGVGKLVKVFGGLRAELEDLSQGVEHLSRGVAFSSLFQPGVVVDAQAGQHGDLIAA